MIDKQIEQFASQATDVNMEEALERVLTPYGYCSLFSHRDEMDQAFQFVCNAGDAVENRQLVVTATMVYVNTLLRCLHHNGQLNLDWKKPDENISDKAD